MTLGLSEKTTLNARRCSVIRNRVSGMEFKRFDDPGSDWAALYDRAFRHPEEFEVEYDSAVAKEITTDYKYSEGELRPKTLNDLKRIALERGATGLSKPELIKNILLAQG